MSPPQMHITGISRLSTLIQRKSELHSPLRFGATTAQSTPGHAYHAPGLARSCCKAGPEPVTLDWYGHAV